MGVAAAHARRPARDGPWRGTGTSSTGTCRAVVREYGSTGTDSTGTGSTVLKFNLELDNWGLGIRV
jgi:hypothetical protein